MLENNAKDHEHHNSYYVVSHMIFTVFIIHTCTFSIPPMTLIKAAGQGNIQYVYRTINALMLYVVTALVHYIPYSTSKGVLTSRLHHKLHHKIKEYLYV